MTQLHRRHFIAAAIAAGICPTFALAETPYPNKPIRIVVPLPAGGAADSGARVVASSLQTQLKQPVIIDNKPGGTYVIGMQSTTVAPADGYTLIALNTGMAAAQATQKRFDLLKSLTPVTLAGRTPCLFVVPAKSGFASMADVVAFAKANPGKLNYGSVGIGALEHLWATMFSKAMGIEITHVPFKGMPDALTALVQGEIHFIPAVLPSASPFVQKGMIRSLGVISDKRLPEMPDMPTLKEQGIAVPPMEFWSGYAVPAGTPAPVVELLRKEIGLVLNDPSVREKFKALGTTVAVSDKPGDFARLIANELDWMRTTVKTANIRLG